MCGAKAALQTQRRSIIEFFLTTLVARVIADQKQIPLSNTAHATSPWDEAARGVCAAHITRPRPANVVRRPISCAP